MKHLIDKPSVPSNRNSKPGAAGLGDRLAASAAAMRKPDVIDVREKADRAPADVATPTSEQMRHADYVLSEISDKSSNGRSIKLGKAYQRTPRFETLFKQDIGIDAAGLVALRFYRETHEAAASSPTRCALNDEGRGGGLPLCLPHSISGMMLDDLHGGTMLDLLERGIGALLPTIRSVALDDKSFSQVAIERYGSRKVSWIDQEKARKVDRDGNRLAYVDKLVPISGRHREIIAAEFLAAVGILTAAHAPYASTARRGHPFLQTAPVTDAERRLIEITTTATPAPVDPDYLDADGRMLPAADLANVIRAKAFGIEDDIAA